VGPVVVGTNVRSPHQSDEQSTFEYVPAPAKRAKLLHRALGGMRVHSFDDVSGPPRRHQQETSPYSRMSAIRKSQGPRLRCASCGSCLSEINDTTSRSAYSCRRKYERTSPRTAALQSTRNRQPSFGSSFGSARRKGTLAVRRRPLSLGGAWSRSCQSKCAHPQPVRIALASVASASLSTVHSTHRCDPEKPPDEQARCVANTGRRADNRPMSSTIRPIPGAR
jgi:hypothetical protein